MAQCGNGTVVTPSRRPNLKCYCRDAVFPLLHHPVNFHVRFSLFRGFPFLVTLQHTLDQVPEGPPEVLARGEAVLVDEEDVLLEAGVEVGLEPELADDGVVVAVDVGVDAVHSLEDLADERGKCFGEGHADARRHDRLVIDVALHPRHELLDVRRGRHLGRALIRLTVLPEVFEPVGGRMLSVF